MNTTVDGTKTPYRWTDGVDYGNIDLHRFRGGKIDRLRSVTASDRNAVAQLFWTEFAVYTYWRLLRQYFGAIDNLLRQKPTSIEQGVPVGTKGLDRDREQRECRAGSQPVRAIRGAMTQ